MLRLLGGGGGRSEWCSDSWAGGEEGVSGAQTPGWGGEVACQPHVRLGLLAHASSPEQRKA